MVARLKADDDDNDDAAFVNVNTSDGDEQQHNRIRIRVKGAGKPWRFQTNFYGNGSTARGREERYQLWFDPTKQFHRYSILWTSNNIIFYVDEVPIREVVRSKAMGGDFPSKPMSLYTTIWDASNWATSGGKAKVNYKYAPFTSEFKDFVLEGCPVDPIEQVPSSNCQDTDSRLAEKGLSVITPAGRRAMRRFRERYMYYSYCYDTMRYPVPLPECVLVPSERQRFKDTGRLKFGGSHKSHRHRSRRQPVASNSEDPDM